MSPNQVRPPTTASPSDPRGLSKGLPETISATFGVTRRKEGHPPPHCWDVTEMLLNLFFLLFSFFFSLAWHLAGQKPLKTNCSVALSFPWSPLLGRSSVGKKSSVTLPPMQSPSVPEASDGRF
ncbi:hypothetical protein C366_02615 [Cryptococcus neoformans Tu401-1]|nr:hypothetical protein C366_02615 [Cryptococcus neoformans var. grubii Tu401-1]